MKIKPEKANSSHETTAPADSASISARVRNTWLGQFYSNHLKKYRIVKLMAPWVWRKIYFLYQLAWIYGNALKLPLIPLLTHATATLKIQLTQVETVITPIPEVFPVSYREYLAAPHTEYQFPEVYIADVPNALVTGGTNLIMTDKAVICHDLYDFTHDYTSEEMNGRAYIWPHHKRIAWLMQTAPDMELARAACFTDACANNYAHWITEVLPRINMFCSLEKLLDVPLIVNEGLHPNLMESLRTVAGNQREIIFLATGSCIRVEHLSLTSVTGYIPFDRRSNRLKNHSHGCFSSFAILSLRQCLQERLKKPSNLSIRKVFIKRNSDIRNIANAREVEELLVARGFSVVEPERLTFAQQVELFSIAEVVVGVTGAALANIVFCKPATKIIIMISDYKHMPYWYWQNMSCAVGNKVTYVIGRCVGATSYLHSDFKVNMSDVLDAID